jgi:hypothetical protein
MLIVLTLLKSQIEEYVFRNERFLNVNLQNKA